MSRKIAFIWHRLGPYHLARAAAMAGIGDMTIVEMSGKDMTYKWSSTKNAQVKFRRRTVFRNIDCDSVPPATVRQELWATLDRAQPDVVFIPSWGANYAIAATEWAIRKDCARVVFTVSAATDKVRKWPAEWVKSRVVRNFGVGLVGGERHAQYLATLGIPRQRVWGGYNCIDNDYYVRAADKAHAEAGSLQRALGLPGRYFLTTCRFIAKKNISLLLKAYERFLSLHPDRAAAPDLVVLGDGPLRPDYERLIGELGIANRVRMPGFKQYDELPKYYGLAEAFVLPSAQEQWGLVVNEAMACGLPVFVSRSCNCVVELVDPLRNGDIFDPTDAEGLANLLLAFDAKTLEQKAKMGRASREIVARYSPQNFAANVWAAAEAALVHTPRGASMFSRVLLRRLALRRNVVDA